jgi:hypothetical protein
VERLSWVKSDDDLANVQDAPTKQLQLDLYMDETA